LIAQAIQVLPMAQRKTSDNSVTDNMVEQVVKNHQAVEIIETGVDYLRKQVVDYPAAQIIASVVDDTLPHID
jgi:hypothetical protein